MIQKIKKIVKKKDSRDHEGILWKNSKEIKKFEIVVSELVTKNELNIDERIVKKLQRKMGRRKIR